MSEAQRVKAATPQSTRPNEVAAMHTDSITVPQVEFHGTGIRVNGTEVDGEILLAWFIHSADRGYVLKFDSASMLAFLRTDEDAKILSGTAKAMERFYGGIAS